MDGISQVGSSDAVMQAAAIFVQKKSMQLEQDAVLTELNSVSPQATTNNPPNLGQNIDVSA